MKKNEKIRAALFLIILLAVLFVINLVAMNDFMHVSQRFSTYDELEEDTVDVLIVGTSGIDRYWIPAKGFDEYGITAYSLSSDRQPAWLMTNVIKENYKQQTPEVVVIDMRPFIIDYKAPIGQYEAGVRYLTDGKRLSFKNRSNAIEKSLDALQQIDPDEEFDRMSFYLPIIKYHSIWDDDNIMDAASEDTFDCMGFYMCSGSTVSTTDMFEDYAGTASASDLHPINEPYLTELLDYLATLDCEVLFISTPEARTQLEAERINTLCQMVSARDFDTLVVPTDETYDREKDFYNDAHVNYYGAEKFSAYFAEYLTSNYDLPDRREDEKCSDWVGKYDEIKETVKEWEEDWAEQ